MASSNGEGLAAKVIEAAAVKPGDTLVVAPPSGTNVEVVKLLAEQLRETLGKEIKVVVIGGGVGLTVLCAGEQSRPLADRIADAVASATDNPGHMIEVSE